LTRFHLDATAPEPAMISADMVFPAGAGFKRSFLDSREKAVTTAREATTHAAH
jgi:hypothetical protein